MRLVVSAPGLMVVSPRRAGAAVWETVLVALENERERDWLAATIRHNGFHVLCARHAGHALLVTFRAAKAIDVLVTDRQLSDMSGAELSARLQSHCGKLDSIFISRPLRPDAILFELHGRR